MKKIPFFAAPCCGLAILALAFTTARPEAADGAALGYYRFPALYKNTLVFTAEGDLWRVGLSGGVAQRLTTHPAEESRPAFSPDGKMLAFSASYEGPTEVYTLPLEGGIPVRQTFDGANALVVGWTPGGEVVYSTRRYSTLPNTQLVRVDPKTGNRIPVPLAQASDGAYDPSGQTLFFTRFAFQGSYTKRYQGGTAQNLWRFANGDREAVPLTADYRVRARAPCSTRGACTSCRTATAR